MKALVLPLLLVSLLDPRPSRAAAVLSAEYAIAALPYEVGIGYDARGRERWRFVGTEDGQAGMPEWMPRSIRNGVFTHNHVGEDGCVNLSVDDVQFGSYYHLAEVRAVGYAAGHVYVAIITHPHWVTYDQWNAAFDRHRALDWCTRGAAAWADLHETFTRIVSAS